MRPVRPTDTTESSRRGRHGRYVDANLRLLFRQLPAVAWITDRDMRIVEFAGLVEETLGLSHDELRGVSIADIAGSDDPSDPAVAAHLAASNATSSSFRYEIRGRWFEVHVRPLRDASQQIIGSIGAAVDITDRVSLEDRTAESEAQFAELQRRSISLLEATIESTADGLLVVDRASHVVALNQKFLELWNVPSEVAARGDDAELLQYVLDQLVAPDAFLARVRDLYATPAAEDLDVLDFKDGRVFERYSRPQSVGGVLVGRVWSFRDVTARERSLRHAVLLADASRLLVSIDATAALEGVAHLLVTKCWEACAFDLFDNGVPVHRIAAARDSVDGCVPAIPTPVASTRTELRPLGDQRELLQVPMLAAGRLVGMVGVISVGGRTEREGMRDVLGEIARRCAVALENARLYERAQADIRAREEFLSVASHEIRGPVASIRLAVDAIRSGVGNPEKLVGVIEREERRLEHLIDELLDLGRAQSGQLHLELESVDLAVIAREVATRLATDARKTGSSLVVRGEPTLSGRWDRLRVDQVITNLVSNAIKFCNGKPIEIALAMHDGRAIVEVTDHGVGIPVDKLTAIFEPFERAVPSRRYGGLGLGLYIVRTLVTLMGGAVSVHSAVNVGTTFTVELPCEPAG